MRLKGLNAVVGTWYKCMNLSPCLQNRSADIVVLNLGVYIVLSQNSWRLILAQRFRTYSMHHFGWIMGDVPPNLVEPTLCMMDLHLCSVTLRYLDPILYIILMGITTTTLNYTTQVAIYSPVDLKQSTLIPESPKYSLSPMGHRIRTSKIELPT